MVFISYRREDTGFVAVDIARELRESLDIEVFLDLGSIDPGQRFEERIGRALQDAEVVVVLIGRGWAGSDGSRRRIDEPKDVFRREIEFALGAQAKVAVIPVLVGDLPTLPAGDLPPSMQALDRLHWHRIRLENKWTAIRALTEHVRNAVEDARLRRLYAGTTGDLSMYRKRFDPGGAAASRTPDDRTDPAAHLRWTEDTVFRVNVALATRRPLLVLGPDGSGRESLAPSIASALGWRYLRVDWSGSMVPGDLVGRMDEARRTADAQVGNVRPAEIDWVPGAASRAFDPGLARPRDRGSAAIGTAHPESPPADADAVFHFAGDPPPHHVDFLRIVEQPGFDLPHGLGRVFKRGHALVVVSAVDERSVDGWARKRAVHCRLPLPDRATLVELGERRLGLDRQVVERVVAELLAVPVAPGQGAEVTPRLVLDTLRAVNELGIDVAGDSRQWRALVDALIR